MARTPRATAVPKIVAQPSTSHELGSSFFDSTAMPSCPATVWALLICAALSGAAVVINHPVGCSCRSYFAMSASLMMVLGASVPVGSPPMA
jgi:hypothetical protein